jgi:hypothetical protein
MYGKLMVDTYISRDTYAASNGISLAPFAPLLPF